MKPLFSMMLLCGMTVVAPAQDLDLKSANRQTKSTEESDFKFDGQWKPKGAMLSGVLLPPAALDAITLKLDGNRYEVTVVGEDHSDAGTFTIDETTTPKRMTIKSQSGPNKGKIILAIFEIKNTNAMRVCYDLSGKEFPTEFKAPKNTELYLVGYRRQETDQSARQPFNIGNRQEPTESQVCALAKSFCVAMRKHHGEKNAHSMREFFDPRYLEKHGFKDGEIKVQMAPVSGIQNIQLADDNRSVLCHFKTKAGQSEVILLRTVVHKGNLYLSPLTPPDKTTKIFTPWILRMSL